MTGRDRIVLVVLAALAVLAAAGCSSSPPSAKRPPSSPPRSAPRRRSCPPPKARSERRPPRRRSTGGLRLAREPRQSRADRPGSALADLPARAGLQPARRRILLDHLRRRRLAERARASSARSTLRRERAASQRRLHPDAVHVRLQRQLLRPLQPVPAARPLYTSAHRRAPAGQRPPADDPGRQARAPTNSGSASTGSGQARNS